MPEADSRPAPPTARPIDADTVATAQALVADAQTIEAISRSLRALGEPTRLRIAVALLAAGELSVTDTAAAIGITEPAASQHLRILRAERLVRNRRQGRVVFYSLADQHVRDWVELALAHAAHD